MTRLYRVESTVNNFTFGSLIYNKVGIDWFVSGRKVPLVSYERAIQNYRKDKDGRHFLPRGYLNGLFAKSEAEALKDHLLRVHNENCEIKEQKLPIPFNYMSYESIPVGGGSYFWHLNTEEGYDLPFGVSGWFDLLAHEVIGQVEDESYINHGKEFIDRVLKEIDAEIASDDEKLESILDQLNKEGLYVQKEMKV